MMPEAMALDWIRGQLRQIKPDGRHRVAGARFLIGLENVAPDDEEGESIDGRLWAVKLVKADKIIVAGIRSRHLARTIAAEAETIIGVKAAACLQVPREAGGGRSNR